VQAEKNEPTMSKGNQLNHEVFWTNKNVFITGPLGFLGKLIVEKILRCFPQVSTLYLLVREMNVSPHQRVLDMLGMN
jgi:hypothetical protein